MLKTDDAAATGRTPPPPSRMPAPPGVVPDLDAAAGLFSRETDKPPYGREPTAP